MPKHHILCVHGVGKHSNDWANKDKRDGDQTFSELLKELWGGLGLTESKGAFESHVQVHSIHYDDKIEEIFANWQQQVSDLKSGLASSAVLMDQVEWFTNAIDAASEAKDEDHFGYTHLMDLIVFAGSRTIQDHLVAYTANQIVGVLNDHPGDRFSIIAHSMGSAMAHKALQALFTENVGTLETPQTLVGNLMFDHITMVANTSYLLSRHKASHYVGVVRPSMTVGKGCCFTWINVNHRFDPVGQIQPFDYRRAPQSAWLDQKISTRNWCRDIQLSKISSKSIHSLNHYFRDPTLHIPFFELALDVTFTPAQHDAAVATFEAATAGGKFDRLSFVLQEFSFSDKQSFKDLIAAIKDFRSAIQQFG